MTKIDQAFALFDAYNRQSPIHISNSGQDYPIEYFYAIKLHEWIKQLRPDATEALLLASRCQHIGRWEIPRDSYPEGRVGYLTWRSDLAKFHAQKAEEILLSIGYDETTIKHVKEIVQKKAIKKDAEVQTMEDALCLLFLQYQYDELIAKQSEEKMIAILQKTLSKMSEQGLQTALTLRYSAEGEGLLKKALAS